jgi:hypothetical protein
MAHPLFNEIDKFDRWAQAESDVPQEERGGEWEIYYPDWHHIYTHFEKLVKYTDPGPWTENEIDRLLYIIARDNEQGFLAEMVAEKPIVLILLTQAAIHRGSQDCKWQLAIQLHTLEDKRKAIDFLEHLVQDEHEYVNRRALLELARLQADTVTFYCERFWNKNKYGALEEYQRIAVLHALHMVGSNKLRDYIMKAKEDGRSYLLENALKLEKSLLTN